jgi:hypothetical protein
MKGQIVAVEQASKTSSFRASVNQHKRCVLYLIAGLLLLIWFALCWIIGTPSRLS